MKTNKKQRKFNSGFSRESRIVKDRIINAMVFSLIAFIAVLLITEMT